MTITVLLFITDPLVLPSLHSGELKVQLRKRTWSNCAEIHLFHCQKGT